MCTGGFISTMHRSGPETRRIACHRCRHYRITWEARFPYGCAAHAFKSRKSPSLEVYEASGMECQLYFPKAAMEPGI
jgi:hypothetical protein